MKCPDLRVALLTADPDELRGVGESDVAQHIRACAECSAAARQILAVTAALASELDRPVRSAGKRAWRSAWPVGAALPIAAALAGLLLLRADTSTQLPHVGSLEDVKQPVVRPVVNAPANRNVAVIEASNNITVVWDLGAKGGS